MKAEEIRAMAARFAQTIGSEILPADEKAVLCVRMAAQAQLEIAAQLADLNSYLDTLELEVRKIR
jgi:hypothetical protein